MRSSKFFDRVVEKAGINLFPKKNCTLLGQSVRKSYTNRHELKNDRCTSKRGAQDCDRINMHENYELRYWSKKFCVSELQLKEAVHRGCHVRCTLR